MEQESKTISLDEILKSDNFRNYVANEIRDLQLKRIKRPEPKPGYSYRRDWYERMTNEGCFNTDYFIRNIGKIWSKTSTLSSEYRGVIQFVCNKALQSTLNLES